MAKWMDAYITFYRPSADISAFRAIMNSQGMQDILLERANVIAAEVKKDPDIARYRQMSNMKSYGATNSQLASLFINDPTGGVSADVQPGRNRAHALVKVRHIYKTEFQDIGRNKRIDQILLRAMNAARISRKR